MSTSRRVAILTPVAAALAASLRGVPAWAGTGRDDGTVWPGFPQQNPELARDTVGAAHSDLDKVRDLTDRHPALVNAAWDWGFGDWETALGAAAHTGRREIAELLIARGARIDLFAAAMLGSLDAVKALIETQPGIVRTPGPHGIPLLAHARAGKDAAAAVVEYLLTVPGSGEGPKTEPLDAAAMTRYAGEFSLPGGGGFAIGVDRERLAFSFDGHGKRFLNYVGADEFFPVGVPSVRFRFTIREARADTVEIRDHDLRAIGTRRD